jgi:hypothetical protein
VTAANSSGVIVDISFKAWRLQYLACIAALEGKTVTDQPQTLLLDARAGLENIGKTQGWLL